MWRKKSSKTFNRAYLHFEKREREKDKKGEKEKLVTFTVRSTIIISISFLTLLIALLKNC
jgi:hypothetical protein